MTSPTLQPRPYELLMLGLSLYVLAALAASTFLPLSPTTHTILNYTDFAICMVFLGEFTLNLARAPDRRAFMKWGWIDLLASIPALDAARVGRAARLIRLLRLLRAFRSANRIGGFLLRRRGEATITAAVLIALLMATFAAIAILEFEAGREKANIHTAADALWWAVATITTVGYGDRYPVTSEGRVIAAVLMTVGVGFFGIFTGLVASWFMAPSNARQDELTQMRAQLDAVLVKLDALQASHAVPSAAPLPQDPPFAD